MSSESRDGYAARADADAFIRGQRAAEAQIEQNVAEAAEQHVDPTQGRRGGH